MCGIEPTGLLGLFRTMWSQCQNHPTAEKIATIIINRLTIEWPSDERLTKAILERPLYGSNIARYAILALERSLGSEEPPLSDLTIEHIMPRNYCIEWASVIEKEQHSKLKDVWANLIPLSESMNGKVDQANFQEKKIHIENESMYVTARKLCSKYNTWGEGTIKERSLEIANWAIERWKAALEFKK